MKKITLMLAFLGMVFSSVQSAFADDARWEGKRIASVSAAVEDLGKLEDGCYLVRNVGHMSYLRENDNKSLYLWNAVPSGSTEVADINAAFAGTSSTISSVVYVSKNMTTKEDGTQEPTGYYTIQFRSGQYIGTSIASRAGGAASSNATAGEIEIVATTTATQFNFHPKDARWADGNGSTTNPSAGSFTDWSTTAPGAGGNGAYQFYPVTLEDNPTVTVTWTVKDAEENTISTFTTTADKNSTVALPTFEKSYFFTDATLVTPENTTITEDNCNFTINVTEGTAPYTASTAAAPVWYTIKLRNDDAHYVNHVLSADNGIGTERANTAKFFKSEGGIETLNGGLWAFVKSGLGVQLLNKQTGKFVKVASTKNTTEASLDATGTTFIVKTNSNNNGVGFSLQVPGDANAHIGDHCGGRLGVWNNGSSQNDNGSCFQIALAGDETLATAKSLLTDSLNHITALEADPTYASARTQASIDAAKAAVEAATSINALDNSILELANLVSFEEGAYYRIVNCNTTNKYLTSAPIFVGTDGTLATSYHAGISGDRVVRRVAEGAAIVPQLWQFINNGNNTFKVKNANTGCRLSSEANPIDMPINVNAGGDYTIKVFPSATFAGNDGKTMAQLIVNGAQMNALSGNNGDTMGKWNDASDKGGYWQFEKVTEVPVAISEANYATVGFPFAVQVPAESGVKAFYVSSIANGTIALTEIENGIIPANQGAILYHEGATDVNLAITTTDATIEGNLLTATAAKRVGYEADANYLLALNEAGNAAFLQSELTSVPANKAFINAENVPAAEAGAATLNFVFNGTTTGINGVAADNANNTEYFDLSGRRVLYPANGIFVTKAGKKVFIK